MSKKKMSHSQVRVLSASVLTQSDANSFVKAASAYVKKATVSKKAAQKTLHRLGTHTASGRLTKRYG